ncbi:MAG: FAD:protein FMN transferase [Alistipes sp.]
MMNKMIKTLLFTLCLGALTACSKPETYVVVDGMMLGTTLHVSADVKGISAQDLYAEVMKLDKEAKASMSVFEQGSLLNRLNRNETDSIDEHIAYNFRLATEVNAISDGRYDVTVRPLVEAWGFAGKERVQHPNIDSILQFVGNEKVHIVGGRLVKTDPRVQLDFNSIAKGYTVDLLAQLVERFGAKNYIVDIGGEIRCRGVNKEGNAWRIGVETPFDGNQTNGEYVQKRIRLQEGGLATSGNYRRFYIDENGNKIAHTIDPRTGHSAVSRLLSVTVVADNCALADAMGTMFLAMGADDALAKAEQMPEVKVYFILSGAGDSYEEYVSPAMKALIMDHKE